MKTYLGDGVYAEFREDMSDIRLSTERPGTDFARVGGTEVHEIFLSTKEIEALNDFVQKIAAKYASRILNNDLRD